MNNVIGTNNCEDTEKSGNRGVMMNQWMKRHGEKYEGGTDRWLWNNGQGEN